MSTLAHSGDSRQTVQTISLSEFNLRARVREVLTTTSLADPRDIATAVIQTLTRDEMAAALATTLPTYIRADVLHGDRATAPVNSQSQGGESPKLRQRRGWAAQLETRWAIDGQWKLLRDCTRNDLLTIAAERRQAAAENLAAAERFERLADAMRGKRGVKTVGDIQADTAEALWDAAA